MTYSLASSSVSATASVATFNIATSAPKNETSSQAINIGNLTEQSSIVDISDAGSAIGSPVSTNFTTQNGDAISLSEDFNSIINKADTRFQLYDSSGAVIADNQGSSTQQALYDEWVAGTLSLPGDTYTALAIPEPNVGLNISATQNQGTSLQVSSQLTGSDSTEYYNFDLTAGNNIKLALDAGTQASSVRVQLYNSSGNLVADSAGNSFQKANYLALTSGTGLTASTGAYTAEVSYANGVNPDTTNVNYNLQFYSGSTYSVLYKNKIAAQPTDTSAVGSVTATTDAQLYGRNSFNKIDEKPSGAVNIGWLAQDKSALEVFSQLTAADASDYYSFTLQTGNNLKFGFITKQTPNANDLRVQILDGSGTRVVADSAGTAAQQAAYKALTTTNGLDAKPGNYLVKVSYATNAPKIAAPYEFQVLSGTTYNALYKTTASAQTYGNALIAGNLSSTSSSAGIASYLTAASQGDTTTLNAALGKALSAKF